MFYLLQQQSLPTPGLSPPPPISSGSSLKRAGSSQWPFPLLCSGMGAPPRLVRKKQLSQKLQNYCNCFQVFECVKDGIWALVRGQGALHIHRNNLGQQRLLTWHLAGLLPHDQVAFFLFF